MRSASPAGLIAVEHAPPGLRELPGRCAGRCVRAWTRTQGNPIVRELQQTPAPGVRSRTGLRTLSGRGSVVDGRPGLRRDGMIPGLAAVQGQRGPDRLIESTTGLTRAGDCVIAPMAPIRPRRRSPGCPWDCVDGRERGRAGPGCNFLLAGANSPGNGLLRAGAEPFVGRAPETAGGANLHFIHLPSRIMPTAGALPVGNARSAGRSDPSNSHRHQRGEPGAPSDAVQAGPWP